MSSLVESAALQATVRSAETIAAYQERNAVGGIHLLLAILGDESSPWTAILGERGLGNYRDAARYAGPLPPQGTLASASPSAKLHRRPMRRLIVDLLLSLLLLAWRRLRPRDHAVPPASLPLAPDAKVALRVAHELAPEHTNVGHLLIALASIPGSQIKLFRREHRVIAAAARAELRLTRARDRWILMVNEPSLRLRRLEMKLRRGNRPMVAFYFLLRLVGTLWATVVFLLETVATLALYFFLWPALLLANAIRTGICKALGVSFTVRRAHEIPGGEMEIAADVVLSDRRAALAILLPRVACFAIAVISILLLFWQTARLGVEPMPIVVTRYDIFQGHLQSADVVAPLLILADALTVNGVVVGVGILAGLGAGILAIPSSREVQLIRLIGGHDVGRGSLAVRCLIAPLAVVTAVFAFFEALLPWKGGPLYLTIYALPVLVAVLVAIEFRPLLPY